MTVKFTQGASVLLWKMLYAPIEVQQNPYRAPDELAAHEVAKLARWLADPKTGLVKVTIGAGFLNVQGSAREVIIKERFVARMKQVVKHYEDGGRLVTNCGSYEELRLALEGKEPEIEDIEESAQEA